LTHQEAKQAKEQLAHTHLYGRHLVLEWAEEDSNDIEELRRKQSVGVMSNAPLKKQKLEFEIEGDDMEDEF
jgi:multiple RNA-binding domain-containing protein 1